MESEENKHNKLFIIKKSSIPLFAALKMKNIYFIWRERRAKNEQKKYETCMIFHEIL